jgi:hypothetical protein
MRERTSGVKCNPTIAWQRITGVDSYRFAILLGQIDIQKCGRFEVDFQICWNSLRLLCQLVSKLVGVVV